MAHKYKRIKPKDDKTRRSKNKNSFVYEHRDVVNSNRSTPLRDDEVVHHLNGNHTQNIINNLISLSIEDHGKLHRWIDKGCPVYIKDGENKGKYMTHGGVKEEKEVFKGYTKCALSSCSNMIGGNNKYCSDECYKKDLNLLKPTKEKIIDELKSDETIENLGKKYSVSGNGYKNWCKSYGVDPRKSGREKLRKE